MKEGIAARIEPGRDFDFDAVEKAMPYVLLRRLHKDYDGGPAVAGIDLDVEQGEFFSLLGPSGCGKSTTLRMIAGFVRATSGTIEIDGAEVSHLAPEKRGIGFVFQNYAIFPHMTVFDNIAFGLRLRRLPKDQIRGRVARALTQVGLAGFDRRYQREMSGGQQQRVALARVLVTEPRLLLLDEPLSSLDKKLREEMKTWIKKLQRSLNITTIYVTHDQGEALALSDRIAVMSKGQIDQVGTPVEIYEKPANRFVTEFIGESNILSARIVGEDGKTCQAEIGGQIILLSSEPGLAVGQAACIAIRPEHIQLGIPQEETGWQHIAATLRGTVYQGAFVRYIFDLQGQEIVVEVANRDKLADVASASEFILSWRTEKTRVVRD